MFFFSLLHCGSISCMIFRKCSTFAKWITSPGEKKPAKNFLPVTSPRFSKKIFQDFPGAFIRCFHWNLPGSSPDIHPSAPHVFFLKKSFQGSLEILLGASLKWFPEIDREALHGFLRDISTSSTGIGKSLFSIYVWITEGVCWAFIWLPWKLLHNLSGNFLQDVHEIYF